MDESGPVLIYTSVLDGRPDLDDPVLETVLGRAPCDVAVHVGRGGPPREGPVLVLFAGGDHDWTAVEVGAWIAGAQGVPLRLAGPAEGVERDASRALASASLAVQRVLGIAAEPVLLAPAVPDVLVSLPDEDQGEQGGIVDLTRRVRDELTLELDAAAPARVTLRFHPTTDSYERATGQAWFTAGAFAKGELHLLPLTTLRDRGVLERTIRRELVRVMTVTALAGRPLWVREGAAIYFADREAGLGVKRDRLIPGGADAPTFRPQPRASCPADVELLRPVSAGALSNAWARARGCFARQIEAGRSWRDVR